MTHTYMNYWLDLILILNKYQPNIEYTHIHELYHNFEPKSAPNHYNVLFEYIFNNANYNHIKTIKQIGNIHNLIRKNIYFLSDNDLINCRKYNIINDDQLSDLSLDRFKIIFLSCENICIESILTYYNDDIVDYLLKTYVITQTQIIEALCKTSRLSNKQILITYVDFKTTIIDDSFKQFICENIQYFEKSQIVNFINDDIVNVKHFSKYNLTDFKDYYEIFKNKNAFNNYILEYMLFNFNEPVLSFIFETSEHKICITKNCLVLATNIKLKYGDATINVDNTCRYKIILKQLFIDKNYEFIMHILKNINCQMRFFKYSMLLTTDQMNILVKEQQLLLYHFIKSDLEEFEKVYSTLIENPNFEKEFDKNLVQFAYEIISFVLERHKIGLTSRHFCDFIEKTNHHCNTYIYLMVKFGYIVTENNFIFATINKQYLYPELVQNIKFTNRLDRKSVV